MKISFNTRVRDINTVIGTNGYGTATNNILLSLKRLGYEVTQNDPTAPVGICFDQPTSVLKRPSQQTIQTVWYGNQYKILYTPWESTSLPPKWKQVMNSVDEVWTPSDLVAEWYKIDGVRTPVYVYEHGIDHSWQPRQRTRNGPTRFLIVGAEASRKNGWVSYGIWREANIGTLTIKMVDSPWVGFSNLSKVTFINETLPLPDLQQLFYDHDVLIHASSGEGFGLPPLQAIATGMPAIIIPDWAPYRRFTDERLHLPARLTLSPWTLIHPGRVYRLDRKSLIDCIKYADTHVDELQATALALAPQVHEAYDWDTLTKNMFKSLEKRLLEKGLVQDID